MKLETRILTVLFSILALFFAGTASDAKEPSVYSSVITWDADPAVRWTLNVSGVGRYEFEPGEAPMLELYGADGEALADGTYTWQLTGAPVLFEEMIEARRKGQLQAGPQGDTASGSFSIAAGAFVDPTLVEGGAEKGQWIPDDLVVQGSACMGCEVWQTFGYDTIRLKSENPRLRFEDTSAILEYPNSDWQLIANESENGGLDKFSIEDQTAATIPFTVEGGAPSDTIYGQSDGDVGIGTNDPSARLHLVDGDTPRFRIEQDTSLGFSSRIWDILGNEQNLAVSRIGTSGEGLTIETGAPNNSVHVAAGGYVGFGTDSPTRPIHIEANDSVHVAFEHTASDNLWHAGAESDAFIVSVADSGGDELEIEETGDIYFRHGSQQLAMLDGSGNLSVTGQVTTGGTGCGGGCDAVFQPGYELETIAEHAAFMWANSYLPAVGPTVENGASWSLTEMTGGMLNELEKAHIYIEQLNDKLRDKRSKILDLKQRLARLEVLTTDM